MKALLYLGSHIWKHHLAHFFSFCKRLSHYNRNIFSIFHFSISSSCFLENREGPPGDSGAGAWMGWAWQTRLELDAPIQAGDRFCKSGTVLMALGAQRTSRWGTRSRQGDQWGSCSQNVIKTWERVSDNGHHSGASVGQVHSEFLSLFAQ